MGEILTPRLFLGADGVLLAPDPPYDPVRPFDFNRNFAPEVVRRLVATGAELVLVDTDEHLARALPDCIEELADARMLSQGNYRHHGEHGVRWLADAIVGDLHDRQAPFMWVSSRINPEERVLIRREFGSLDHVAMPTDPAYGIGHNQLASIERFAAKHTVR